MTSRWIARALFPTVPKISSDLRSLRRATGTTPLPSGPETTTLRRAFWDEFSSATPDGERLDSLLKRMTGARLRYHRQTLAAALELIETLSPDQRREFRAIIREHDPFGLRSLTGSIPRRDPSHPAEEAGSDQQ